MNSMGWRRISLKVVLATLAASALFLHLADWQWQKSQTVQQAYEQYEQRVQQAPQRLGAGLLDPTQVAYLPLEVRGEYETDGQFFLDNQQHEGVPGVHVITPLRIEGTSTRVWVNRGWVPWGASRAQLPRVNVPSGVVEVHGLAFVPSTRKAWGTTDVDATTDSPLKMRLDLSAFAQRVSYAVQPFVILQNDPALNDGLIRVWPAPENKSSMHRGYAIQWILITLALIIGVVYSWRIKRPD